MIRFVPIPSAQPITTGTRIRVRSPIINSPVLDQMRRSSADNPTGCRGLDPDFTFTLGDEPMDQALYDGVLVVNNDGEKRQRRLRQGRADRRAARGPSASSTRPCGG